MLFRSMAPGSIVVAASALLAGVPGCRQAEPPVQPQAIGDIRQIMRMLDPSADAVWGSVGTIVSSAGVEERKPRDEKEWDALLVHAVTVAETGNLLMLPGRAVDGDEWMARAESLRTAGREAVLAVAARDSAGVLTAGERITDACDRCHQTYWKKWHDTDIE